MPTRRPWSSTGSRPMRYSWRSRAATSRGSSAATTTAGRLMTSPTVAPLACWHSRARRSWSMNTVHHEIRPRGTRGTTRSACVMTPDHHPTLHDRETGDSMVKHQPRSLVDGHRRLSRDRGRSHDVPHPCRGPSCRARVGAGTPRSAQGTSGTSATRCEDDALIVGLPQIEMRNAPALGGRSSILREAPGRRRIAMSRLVSIRHRPGETGGLQSGAAPVARVGLPARAQPCWHGPTAPSRQRE
jgi:hypothetical protein